MNEDMDIRVTLAQHTEKFSNIERRICDLETDNKVIMQLSNSVQKLAINMEQMLSEQRDQGERLKVLEDAPAQAWTSAKKTAFTSIISTIAGALATSLIYLIVNGL